MNRRTLPGVVTAFLASIGLAVAVSTPAYAWNVDRPRITDSGIDFGGEVFSLGVPVAGGHLYWRVGPPDYDIVSPELDGTLHLDGVAQHCGRMHMSFHDAGGNLLHLTHGGEVCTNDNAHHHWHVNLQPFSSEDITDVTICTELRLDVAGADWDIIGCDTMIKDLKTQ